MALNIEFEGFVNEVKQFDWGTVLKVAHTQRAKDDATGVWSTVGKDYLDVTLPAGASASEGDLVKVTGTFKVTTFEKRDGTTGVALKVRAQDIVPVDRSFKSDPVGVVKSVLGADLVDDGMPF